MTEAFNQRLALRALLVPVYGLAGIGTAAAYFHFVVGSIAGFEGIAKGRYFLGPLLSLLCVLAAFALWRVWLIGGRIWRYGEYSNASPRDRSYDKAGLVAATIAFVGFAAITPAIHRGLEVVSFSILLGPAACIAIIVFRWSLSEPKTPSTDQQLRPAAGLQLADLPGLVSGIAIGLFGVYSFVPLPISGWGLCDWTVFYPLYPDLWPTERMEVYDACSRSMWTLSTIGSVLSLVCVIAGAVAAFIGKHANAERAGWAAAIVVGLVLARLAIQTSVTPAAPHIAWVASLIAGVLIVMGAAWLGYVGGKCGVRLRGLS